jgi:hypothetical protein
MESNDNYQYEEQQERMAMMKAIHLPMKNWFNALDADFTVRTIKRAPVHAPFLTIF